MADTSILNYKLIIVGDGAVGKTSILVTYTTNCFPDIYSPTIFENFSKRVIVENQNPIRKKKHQKRVYREIYLTIFDTAGQEGYENLRKISYDNVDIVILCFSIMCHNSFTNILDIWWPEIKMQAPMAKIILVGTKKDLQNDSRELIGLARSGKSPITYEQAELLKNKIGAHAYVG